MLIEESSRGPLALQEVKLVFNTSTNVFKVELILSQLYSYGKYEVDRCRMHYQETRKCNYVLSSISAIEDFDASLVKQFIDINKEGQIYLRRSFDVLDILDPNEKALLYERNQETSRITKNNPNYVGPYHNSLEYYMDKYVCLNEVLGYEFYGIAGRYQYSKSYFSSAPKADIDYRIGVAFVLAINHMYSSYLNQNKQRIFRLTIELEEARRNEMVELMSAKHYELTNYFNNVIAAVVSCGNPATIVVDLKKAGSYINVSNQLQVNELRGSFLIDPISVLNDIKRKGSAYFVSPEGRFQEAYTKYVDTCFIITGFLFGTVNAGVRIGIDSYFHVEVSANDILNEVLCSIEYLDVERELINDDDKRESMGKTLHSLRNNIAELYA